jgi:hypothetical protein
MKRTTKIIGTATVIGLLSVPFAQAYDDWITPLLWDWVLSYANPKLNQHDQEIVDLQIELDALKLTEGPADGLVTELNLTQIEATPGDFVDINGISSEIIEYSFQRFDNDESWVLEYPSYDVAGASQINTTVNLQLVRNPATIGGPSTGVAKQYEFSIDEYKAFMNQSYGSSEIPSNSFGGTVTIKTSSDVIYILVGEETFLQLVYRVTDPLPANSTKFEREAYFQQRVDSLPYLEIRPQL